MMKLNYTAARRVHDRASAAAIRWRSSCKADGLLDDQMQRIAREFNLSETVFITKPQDRAQHRGGAHLHAPGRTAVRRTSDGRRRGGARARNKVTAIRLEEKIGLITGAHREDRPAHRQCPLRPAAAARGRRQARPTRTASPWRWASSPRTSAAACYQPAVYSAGVDLLPGAGARCRGAAHASSSTGAAGTRSFRSATTRSTSTPRRLTSTATTSRRGCSRPAWGSARTRRPARRPPR